MAEDFNKLRMLSRKLVATDFQKDWLFRLEVEGEPAELDLYVKDIAYNPLEVTTDEENYGGVTMSWPTGRVPVKITATMRDNTDRRISAFICEWCEKAVHADGTVACLMGPMGMSAKSGCTNSVRTVRRCWPESGKCTPPHREKRADPARTALIKNFP